MEISNIKENKFLKWIVNKYVITILVFAILLLFSPNNNIIYYFKIKEQCKEVEQQKKLYLRGN